MKKASKSFSKKNIGLIKVLLKKHYLLWIISIITTVVCLVLELYQPVFFKHIIDRLSDQEDLLLNSGFFLVIMLYTVFLLLSKGLIFLDSLLNAKLRQYMAQTCRADVFTNVISHSLNFFTKKKTGAILERCSTDTDTLVDFLVTQYKPIVRFLLVFIVSFSTMWRMDKTVTLISVLFIPIFFLSNWLMFQKVLNVWRRQSKTFDAITSIMQENISNMALIRVCGKQAFEVNRFDTILNQLNKIYKDSAFWCSINFQTNWKIPEFQKMIILLVIIFMITSSKYPMTAGDFLLYISYSTLLLSAFGEIGEIFGNISKMTVSIKRIQEIRDENLEYSKKSIKTDYHLNMPVILENVTVNYDNIEILKNISLYFHQKEKVAISGKVGSGKTSLAKLLAGMIEESYWRGSIKYGEQSIRDIDICTLRSRIVLVPQNSILFRKSIKDNLLVGCENIPWEKVKRACRITESLEFIQKSSEGFDTFVGDHGRNLSGGQRQRLCLARALLRDFDVLILDDSFSAVDNKTVTKIWNNLIEEYPDKCIIVISNQMEILQKVDRTIILENGYVKDQGTHKELISKDGFYKSIYQISIGEK